MKVIGLTGGIATGKSTVANTIEAEGVAVVDCDKIAHAVVKKVSRSFCRLALANLPSLVQGGATSVYILL